MNTLVIEKQTGGYFKFTLNGDTANAITSIQNDLLAVGTQLHFKTGNGANIIKEQFIYPADVTIIASGTFTFTTVAQVWDKLIDIDYFAWLGGGGTGGVDRFDDLLDTFSYTGNAGKAVVVDGSELRLVPITLYNKRLFTELEDTPSSLVPNKMLVVNPAGTAVVLQDQPEQPEQLLNSVGYFDYNDLATQTTPLNAVANVALKLTNDTEGANTSTDQNPYGVSYVWDYTTNQFNFNELEVGDTIDVRIHVQVTTTSANQKVLLSAKFGIGSVAEFTNIIYENQFKSAGLHEINFVAPFYMGSTYITDNPAELYLTTDSSATVKVDGWYVRILRKNINIITVDYTVPDATGSVKGIVRLAGDLAGTANSPTVPELANKVPTSRTVSTTSPLLGGGALSSNLTLSIQQANSVDSGYLSNVDWSTFNAKANDNAVVKLTGDQTISGVKTFSNPTIFNSSLNIASGAYSILYNPANSAYWQTYVDSSNVFNFGYNGNIVKASISNSGNFTANSFIKSGGTSSQFLKADGSIDSTTYQTALTNPVTGSLTTNYLPKATGPTNLGNSSFFDNGGIDSGITNASYSQFILKGNGTNDVGGGVLKFSNQTKDFAQITGETESASNGMILFRTLRSNSIVESMRITSGGNVGIGTTSPDQKLTVEGNIRAGGVGNGFLLDTLGVNYTNGMKVVNNYETVMFSGRGSSGYVIAGDNNLRFGFGTNYSAGESMRITSGGSVGIGTTSPVSALTVGGSSGSASTPTAITMDGTYRSGGASFDSLKFYLYKSSTETYGFGLGDLGDIQYWAGTTSTGTHRFFTSQTERMRITSGGNVGIGTTSPGGKLHVVGEGIFDDGTNGRLTFANASSQNDIYSTTTSFGGWKNLRLSSNELILSSGGNTERMRITSGGNVGIGTTSPVGKLSVIGDIIIGQYSDSITNNFDIRTNKALFTISPDGVTNGNGTIISYSWANGGQGPLKFSSASGVVMSLTASGTVNITSLGTGLVYSDGGTLTSTNPSDNRLKDNITDLNYGLNEILQLRPVSYNWKNDVVNQGKQFGFIAQEVQEIMPELVKEFETEEGERLGLDKEGIYAALVNAIKEQQKQIDELKKLINK